MKKTFVFVATVLFMVALGLSSCKTTQDCPAYSKIDVEKNKDNA